MIEGRRVGSGGSWSRGEDDEVAERKSRREVRRGKVDGRVVQGVEADGGGGESEIRKMESRPSVEVEVDV